ncbi:MAG TPA: VanZ family protein [Thermoanaerobacterales bacterium]|nr:VanZ family protein [Thermoanaerobacterales bacterium]
MPPLSAFVLSLMFEIIQLLTAIGTFDVDDILLNLLGAVLGYLFYQIFMRFIKENKYYYTV